ncbi:hypothetical protein BP422_15685 [Brevibacillus formosus]|uniref:PcfJ-like protein n=1 Tax=Brevibacillus formosus TaxID=54913 RepID=A0A220MIM8_9BACL|nr:PcfJ domain-containing protein [Brevibacillus formosus]ASJ54881.1 hypothetical protein BP422_15685 [Brevibacillus formosus]
MSRDQIKNEAFQRFIAHFPEGVSEEIKDYVTNHALLHSRYIFTRRVSGIQFGYCTHCEQEYMSQDYLKPGSKVTCKKCQSYCTVKASGLSRKYLRDSAYVVYYEKSLVSKNAIIARGFYVERDFTGGYYQVQTKYTPIYRYLFEPGNSEGYYASNYRGKWVKDDKVRSCWREYSYSFEKHCCFESIVTAVAGTPFQYSTWEHYTNIYHDPDMVKFFDLYCKSPCVEFLTKAGMRYFVSAKITGNVTYGAINWKGIKAQEVLKLNGQQIREIRMHKGELHPLTLRLQQIVSKDGSKLSLSELHEIAKKYDACFEDLKRILKYTSLRRAINYIEKQSAIERKNRRDSGPMAVTRTFRDYIVDCKELGLNLKSDQILFPRKLHEAHQYTLKQVKDNSDELLNAKIKKRAESLIKNKFERDGLLIRPANSATELIAEGKALEHCVGRYVDNYAKGKTDLYVVRKVANPDKPFYTLEVQKGKVIQCRGLKNCSMTKPVQEFIDVFSEEKLTKKKRVESTQPQEVAV